MDSKVELSPHISPLWAKEVDKSRRWTVFLAVISANLYTLVLGMVESYPAPATVDMAKAGSRFMDVTQDQVTWIASLPVLGCPVGCFISGFTTQILGRRATLILISPWYVVSWLMIVYAPSISWIYAGRFLCGLCFGIGCVPVPAYSTEISPVKIRGLLGTINHLSYAVGCFVLITLAYWLRWSWLAVAGAAITTVGACLMVIMPESPEFLLRKSRRTEAVQSLRFFRGKHVDIEKELESLSQNISHQSKTNIDFQMFIDPTLYKPFFISITLVIFSKFSGINIITAYTVEIFQNTGSVLDAQSSTVLFATVNIVATTVTTLLVDRVGRRKLYVISGSFLTIALGILGLYDFLEEKEYDVSDWHWVPLLSLFMYISFYSLGLGPMVLTMIPEMVPIQFRSTFLAIALICSSLLAFVLTKSFAVMVDNLQYYGLFWIFAVSTFLATLFGIFVLPETKGRTINEINNSFRSKSIKL